MATFNVFVEGPVDDSPTALAELAEAMSQRYGLPAQDLINRMKRGRFRVKANVDAAMAERYRKDLAAIGARVVVEDHAASPMATPVAGTPAVRPSSSSLPPANRPPDRPSTPPSALAAAKPAHQRPSTPIPTDMASGLAAAFTAAPVEQDLGALSGNALSLASLDGEEASQSADVSFDTSPEPPPEPPPAAVKFAPPKPNAAPKPKKPTAPSQPLDLFAPPDAGDQDVAVDLAVDELADRAKKKASAPATEEAPAPMAPVTRKTPLPMTVVSEAPRQFERGRFVLAVVVGLVIGFLPAHFIAKMREESAFRDVDAKVERAHASTDSHETWAALDGAREKLLEEKQSKRQMIALTSMLIWGVVAAGVAFAISRAPMARRPSQPAA